MGAALLRKVPGESVGFNGREILINVVMWRSLRLRSVTVTMNIILFNAPVTERSRNHCHIEI
jgi:hypothetical protein